MMLDTGRLNAVVVEELHAFESDVDVQPVPRHQEMRAGTIAWIARFIPEAIPADTGMVIAATTGRLHRYPAIAPTAGSALRISMPRCSCSPGRSVS